jgi:PAS domain S-box-containing protein
LADIGDSPDNYQGAELGEALSAAVLASAADAVIAANRSGVICYWNPGAERIFGFASAEAVGKSLDIIIPKRLRERHWHGYAQVMQTGKSRYGAGDLLAVPGLRKDGARISLEFTVVLLRAKDGRLQGIGAVMRDVTKRFQELQELRKKLSGS